MRNHHLFLTLKVFSATGGIEKVCRVAGKSLFDMTLHGKMSFEVYSLHDRPKEACGNRYFPSEYFFGFGGNRLRFVLDAVRKGRRSRIVILSHVNLMIVGWLIRLISPRTQVVLFAHGIEVWSRPGLLQRFLVSSSSRFLCVSHYTASVLADLYRVPPSRCVVLNNCLDPYLPVSKHVRPLNDLRRRYGIGNDDKLLLTLTRVSSKERYKGYERVMQALIPLSSKFPGLKYMIAGGYDADEKAFIENRIRELGIEGRVILAGYIEESELEAHFRISDLYVMPSLKEGFGIVFIEAMYFGLPVIGGNKDGTPDALDNGKLGTLVDPFSQDEIVRAIDAILTSPQSWRPDHAYLIHRSGYPNYRMKFEKALEVA